MPVFPSESAPPPSDLVGSRFLGSVGIALLLALWGSACGYFVESAATSSPQASLGAVVVALLLTGCAAALAFVEGTPFGVKEALGRALREGIRSSWQGAWLGGMVGGAFAAGSGLGLLLLVLAAAAVGGTLGLLLGRRWHIEERVRRLNLALSFALLAGFIVTAFWGTPGMPSLSGTATAAAVQASPVFGPSAAWVWGVCGAVPCVLAVVVCWFHSYRGERAGGREHATGLGWAVAALLFVVALAAGLGAALGTGAQWLAGQLVLGGALTPTAGKWLGAAVALLLWGLGRQASQATPFAGIRQRLDELSASLLRESAPAADAPALTEAR